MSTRSSIAMLNIDGTVHAHYCHSDGYLSYNGEMLYEHYQDVNKVKELIALGDMSSLAPEVSPPNGANHSFDSRYDDVCVFYGRDRKESDVDTQKYPSLEDYLENGNFQEYDYIFNEKKSAWFLINHKTKKLQKLANLLLKDESVSDHTKKMIVTEKDAKKLEKELKTKNKSESKLKI